MGLEGEVAFREVTMEEIREVLRLWGQGLAKKRIARQLALDPKTVRRYLTAAQAVGLSTQDPAALLSDASLSVLLGNLHSMQGRPHGPAWELCQAQHDAIKQWLAESVKLSKIRRLLQRRGVQIPYPTLHRYAVSALDFGKQRRTIAVLDGDPGQELQVDTGWMTHLLADERGHRKRFRAWIFSAVRSRHRFVYPCLRETTETAIEACEAAWEFFGGVFRVLLPDNTKVIVQSADPLQPLFNAVFLEYAQARGFVIDPARVRSPQDKARVERAVTTVRDDCFGGEQLRDVEAARRRARDWCLQEYGMRLHSTTQRRPLEVFEAEELPVLLPAPVFAYDTPQWSDPKVARDHYAQVGKALYSLPTQLIGKKLRARADRNTVRFYDRGVLVKTHPRQPPGQRCTDRSDFPTVESALAHRDVAFFERQAGRHGESVGEFARALLAVPLPWTRMRAAQMLIGLVKRFGASRVEAACKIAIAAEMIDVYRLKRMLELPQLVSPDTAATSVSAPPARFLRPSPQHNLPLEYTP
jgi:transposase